MASLDFVFALGAKDRKKKQKIEIQPKQKRKGISCVSIGVLFLLIAFLLSLLGSATNEKKASAASGPRAEKEKKVLIFRKWFSRTLLEEIKKNLFQFVPQNDATRLSRKKEHSGVFFCGKWELVVAFKI